MPEGKIEKKTRKLINPYYFSAENFQEAYFIENFFTDIPYTISRITLTPDFFIPSKTDETKDIQKKDPKNFYKVMAHICSWLIIQTFYIFHRNFPGEILKLCDESESKTKGV